MTVSHEPVFRLRRPLEDTLRAGHPWLYREAVEDPGVPAGTVVRVEDRRGQFVARGLSEDGVIAVRVFTTRDEVLGPALLAHRVSLAASLRESLLPPETDAWRLLHGEGDRLPGFVCDVYDRWAVLATDGAAARVWRDAIVEALRPVLAARGVTSLLWRDRAARAEDPGGAKVTVLEGALPDGPITVREHGMSLALDLAEGQKTGMFVDQRESRRRVRGLSRGRRVLNLYAYTGGFSIAAGVGGATFVETVDVARGALAMAARGWSANGLPDGAHRLVAADVPEHVARLRRDGARFDLVIADPPSFAPNEKAVPKAIEAYRRMHETCLALVSPGGLYLAASCSSHVTPTAFEATVAQAVARGTRAVQRLESWGAPFDHPRIPAFPEGEYLKCSLYRISG